ncbi:MAG: N-acetylmuramoyl-L-alanine amidase [Clostridia bacterium]|nr:N-acetylmuramoyl-L-alanine amidase [Clostridia bacterium]
MKKWMCGILVLTLLLAGLSGLAEGEWAWIEEPTPALSGRLSGIVIGIDPGHQSRQNSEQEAVAPGSSETKPKVSSGTAGVKSGIAEYVVVLDVGLQLRDALEALGATVYMTRETHDVDISNQERAVMMNELGADLVLRIHCNGSTNRSANGIGLYVNKTGPIAEDSFAAAEAILPAMTAATGARADGIFRRDTYTGLNWSEVPCILVEMGFMSNPEEDMKLVDPGYQQLLVKGMTEGVCNYFGR